MLEDESRELVTIREAIPFLQEIPDQIYYQLDPRGFMLPVNIVEQTRQELERVTNHYVMTYRRDHFSLDRPIDTHLCAVIAGAKLNREHLNYLIQSELITNKLNISLVVYKKPLELIDPSNSWLFEIYRQKGLI